GPKRYSIGTGTKSRTWISAPSRLPSKIPPISTPRFGTAPKPRITSRRIRSISSKSSRIRTGISAGAQTYARVVFSAIKQQSYNGDSHERNALDRRNADRQPGGHHAPRHPHSARSGSNRVRGHAPDAQAARSFWHCNAVDQLSRAQRIGARR